MVLGSQEEREHLGAMVCVCVWWGGSLEPLLCGVLNPSLSGSTVHSMFKEVKQLDKQAFVVIFSSYDKSLGAGE